MRTTMWVSQGLTVTIRSVITSRLVLDAIRNIRLLQSAASFLIVLRFERDLILGWCGSRSIRRRNLEITNDFDVLLAGSAVHILIVDWRAVRKKVGGGGIFECLRTTLCVCGILDVGVTGCHTLSTVLLIYTCRGYRYRVNRLTLSSP